MRPTSIQGADSTGAPVTVPDAARGRGSCWWTERPAGRHVQPKVVRPAPEIPAKGFMTRKIEDRCAAPDQTWPHGALSRLIRRRFSCVKVSLADGCAVGFDMDKGLGVGK